VDGDSPAVLATSAMRMPRRPFDAMTRSVVTARSMLCVPLRASLGAGVFDAFIYAPQ